jgi:hypothetical protein
LSEFSLVEPDFEFLYLLFQELDHSPPMNSMVTQFDPEKERLPG